MTRLVSIIDLGSRLRCECEVDVGRLVAFNQKQVKSVAVAEAFDRSVHRLIVAEGTQNVRIELDAVDRRLLVELQHDADLSNEVLAERVALSPSAVHRRIRKLQKSGVIERRIVVVNAGKVGRDASFVVGIEVERERSGLVQQLRKWLLDEPSVQQAYYVTGSADYVLFVTATNMVQFDELMSRLLTENSNVRRFTTNVVMSTIKRGLVIPIE